MNNSKFAILALSAILLTAAISPTLATAVEFKTDLESNSVIITDDQGKDFVGTVTTESGFDESAFDGTVIGGGDEEPTTTEPTTDNGTSGNVTEIPDVVVVPTPEGNDTTIVIITENDTAIIENGETNTNVTEIDNTNGTTTNTTTTDGTDNVEIIVDLPGVSNETTSEEPIVVVTDGNVTDGGTGTNVTETPIEVVNGTDGQVTCMALEGCEPIPTTDNGTEVVEPPVVVNGTDTVVTPDTGVVNGTDNQTEPQVDPVLPVDPTQQQECPITGQLYQPDGSLKEFKLCYV